MPKRRAASAKSASKSQESLKTADGSIQGLEEQDDKTNKAKTNKVGRTQAAASSASSLVAKGKKGRKTPKKQGQIKPKPNCVVYIGHIPHGFYEDQIKGFFSQFGDVKRARVSRNMKTGGCRGYGFIEFKQPEVAKIAAETMHNYELFERYLQVHVVPKEKLHRRMFEGADKEFKEIPRHAIHKSKMEKPTSENGRKRRMHHLVNKERQKRAKLADLGIDYEFNGFVEQIEPLLEPSNDNETEKTAATATTGATSTSKRTARPGSKRGREQELATSESFSPPMTRDKESNVKTPTKSTKKSKKNTPKSTPNDQGTDDAIKTPGNNNSAVARRTRNRSTKKRKQ